MRAIRKALVILFLCGLIACGPRANSLAFLDYQIAGDRAFIDGKYDEAEKHYQKSLAEAEKNGANNQLVQIALHSLGINYVAWGKLTEAESTYERQIVVSEKVFGPDGPGMLSPLIDITWLLINQNRFGEAEAYNKRARGILTKLKMSENRESFAVVELQRQAIEQSHSNQ